MGCIDCGYMTDAEKNYIPGSDNTFPRPVFLSVQYGICPKCTPKNYIPLISAIQDIKIDAGREWDAKFADKKAAFIKKKAAKLTNKAVKLYNSKKPANAKAITDVPAY